MEEPYYIAFDPGKATGWATWNKEGEILDFGTAWSHNELQGVLESQPDSIKVVIYEDFKLFKHKARQQSGSRMDASLAIGRIDAFAAMWGAKVIRQDSNIKPIAEKMTGRTTKGMAHYKTHVIDATNHGDYYLFKAGVKEIRI